MLLGLRIFLTCVCYSTIMSSILEGEDPQRVDIFLQNNLLSIQVPEGITPTLAYRILGQNQRYVRSIYMYSDTVILLDFVAPDDDTLNEVMSLSGQQQDDAGTIFSCHITLAVMNVSAQIIAEFAHCLTHGPTGLRELNPAMLFANPGWVQHPGRVVTPIRPMVSEISDVPPEPVHYITTRRKDKVVLPIAFGNLNLSYPPASTPRPKDRMIPNIATPQSEPPKVPDKPPTPFATPVAELFAKAKQRLGLGGPTGPQSPKSSNLIDSTKPQDPPTQPSNPSKSSQNPQDPEDLPRKPNYPFKDPPKVPRNSGPYGDPLDKGKVPSNPLSFPPLNPQQPSVKSPVSCPVHPPKHVEIPVNPVLQEPHSDPNVTIAQLQNVMTHLATPDLRKVIGTLIAEDKRRGPTSQPLAQPPCGQGQVPHLGGQVGAAGGYGGPEPGYGARQGVENPILPPLNFEHQPINSSNLYQHETVRGNNTEIPQIADYSALQTSFQAMSEGLLKAALKEGVLRQDTPKLHSFSGKEDEKTSWRRWELQVKGLIGSYTDRAIKEAMNKALQGDAAIVADSLDDDCTWQELLEALKAKFASVSSLDVMMKNFYAITQTDDSISQYAIKLEKILGSIRVSHPQAFSKLEFASHLRNRFFHGLTDHMRSNLRYKYDQGSSYEDLLLCARQIEGEKQDERKQEVLNSSPKPKAIKAAAIQNVKNMSEMQKLEKAYRTSQGEFSKLQQQMVELQKLQGSLQASQISSQPSIPKRQANSTQQQPNNSQNSTAQSSGQNGKGYYNPNYSQNRGRGRGGYRWRGGYRQAQDPPGKPQGWIRLCYWCRDYVPFEEANHRIVDCPFYKQCHTDWWMTQTQPELVNPNPNQHPPEAAQSPPEQGN